MQTSILEYLEKSAENFPDKISYADENISYTFGELHEFSRNVGTYIANRLNQRGPVVVYMEKSPIDIIAFMGILYSGGYYVPVDVTMPAERIALINNNLSPIAVITDKKHLEEAESVFNQITVIDIEAALKEKADEEVLGKIRDESMDTDPAYIIYTSGSTGVPKGVVIAHRSLIDYMEHFCPAVGVSSDDVIANQAPFYFDASLIDIYCTLKMGATMYITPLQLFSMPLKLLEFLEEKKVTFLRWVPSALKIVSTFKGLDSLTPSSLKTIIFGAESMPTKCYNYWHNHCQNVKFIQIYGPTEITGVCTYHVIDREYEDSETIPIGKAFKNSSVFLLDEEDSLITKTGQIGEICVKGTCLALGYFNCPEVTNKVFTQNPLNKLYPELIYRTGDLASLDERGNLVFAARKDFQIKHMGHRIELGEIETCANSLSAIESAIALFDVKKDKIHLCYTSDTADDVAVLEGLKDKLQRYMIPNVLHKLDEMPLTLSGKADRVALKNKFIK